MIRFEEALAQILEAVTPLDVEKVGLIDALGRVLGEDTRAGRNLPPADNSAMDGYAVRAGDTAHASAEKPVVLDVIEEIPAGVLPAKTVGPGQAARIMTGAPMPSGADAVVPLEDTEAERRSVKIFVNVQRGSDVRLSGEDVREGELVVPRGTVIRPAEVGMLAALGRACVSVHQRPLVAILATGDELTDIDGDPSSGKLVSSNSYTAAAQAIACGAVPMQLGIAKDRKEALREKFKSAARADIIVSSGGVSVGDYDLVKDVMKEAGNRLTFWQVAMKPGKQLAFGSLGQVPFFGLPGNPVSSMVAFEQFIRPSLLKMMGHKHLFREVVDAALEEDVAKKEGMRYFLRGRLEKNGNGYTVSMAGAQGSGMLKSMVRANGLIVLPEEAAVIRRGERVAVQLFDGA